MSRSTVAKSRQEKTNKVASAPTPAVTHEIVPGKFNDQDWNAMLDRDDGDDFIHGIVEEVCSSAMDTIFQNYIQKQLIPYTVTQAKDALLQIIEWQFLARDEGEGDVTTDVGWAEDEEPEPATTDCWAQGSVPRTLIPTPVPPVIPEEDEEVTQAEAGEEEQEEVVQMEAEIDLPPPLEMEPTVIVEEKTSLAIEETIQEQKDDSPESKAQARKKKRGRGYKPHTGPVRSSDKLDKLTEPLEKTEMKMMKDEYDQYTTAVTEGSPDPLMQQMPTSCQSILKVMHLFKLQAGRPPGNRDVIYDAHGNVVSVNKLDPEKLPTHSVKTKFVIVDPSEEPKKHGIQLKFQVVDPSAEASQTRLEAMRKGKALAPKPPPTPSPRSSRHSRHLVPYQPYTQTKEGVTPLPPPLLESMVVAPGVIVREGDRIKKGPKQRPKQADLITTAQKRGLHAIHIKSGDPTVSVAEILHNQQPVIKPIETSPIPPISSQTQQRSPVC